MVRKLFTSLLLLIHLSAWSQEHTLVLDTGLFEGGNAIWLADTGNWVFKKGHNPSWAAPNINTTDWDTLRPAQIETAMTDENGRLEGWFRLKIKIDSTFTGLEIGMIQRAWAATDVFINGELLESFGNTGMYDGEYASYDRDVYNPTKLPLQVNQEHVIAIHMVDEVAPMFRRLKSEINVLHGFFNITGPRYQLDEHKFYVSSNIRWSAFVFTSIILLILFWLIYLFNRQETHLLFIAITITVQAVSLTAALFEQPGPISFHFQQVLDFLRTLIFVAISVFYPLTIGIIFKNQILKIHWYIAGFTLVFWIIQNFGVLGGDIAGNIVAPILLALALGFSLFYLITSWKTLNGAKWAIIYGLFSPIAAICVMLLLFLVDTFLGLDLNNDNVAVNVLGYVFFLGFPFSLLVYVSFWFRNMITDARTKSENLVKMAEEKKQLLSTQKEKLEKEVSERTAELNQSLENLKSTQSQLVHSEKMASLGELTAGIAHEIQNPLNFVNNFSEVNSELVEELIGELSKGNIKEAEQIGKEIIENEEKITHHGKRAEQIVKSMLQHSRGAEGQKELTDINALCDEYMRLAYHGFRAKDPSFNADFKLDLDPTLPEIKVVPQDIGRVLLNIINNAFQAVAEIDNPIVTLQTQKLTNSLTISIADNGPGIPDEIREKIFQPFFTTKPTGQGTGLGLSLSYDIVTKGHGGTIDVESGDNGTQFIITLT